MKQLRQYALAACTLALAPAFAQPVVEIGRMLLGSGEPGQPGVENATMVANDVYHVPQYLPGFPTAATIWPRVIEVPCRSVAARLRCDGYNWTPAMGRGEYLYFTPVLGAVPQPVSQAAEQEPLALKAAVALAPIGPPEWRSSNNKPRSRRPERE
jgi:hypothetical protein